MKHTLSLVISDDQAPLPSLRFLRSFADNSSSSLIIPEQSAMVDALSGVTLNGQAERRNGQRRSEESEGRQEDRESGMMDAGSAMPSSASSSLRFLRSFADSSSSLLTVPKHSALADGMSGVTLNGRAERRNSQRRSEESEGRQEDVESGLMDEWSAMTGSALSSLRFLRSFADNSSSSLIIPEQSAMVDALSGMALNGQTERRNSQRRSEESEGRREDRESGMMDAGSAMPGSASSSLRFLRSFADNSSSSLIVPGHFAATSSSLLREPRSPVIADPQPLR
jgi:hypothetical protein